MSVTTLTEADVADLPLNRRELARGRFPPRPAVTSWPATERPRTQVHAQLTGGPVALNRNTERTRHDGVSFLLDWLSEQPGQSWQQRWLASGADAAGAGWRQLTTAWLRGHDQPAEWRQDALTRALLTAISADVVRPSLDWLVDGASGQGALVRSLARTRDPAGFARLRAACAVAPEVSPAAGQLTLHRTAVIVAAKGGTLADISVGDVLELLDAEAAVRTKVTGGTAVFYRMLHQLGIFGEPAPVNVRHARSVGQRTPDELIDRYQLSCRPIRDLLVDYLRERQPTLDYTSLNSLAHYLAKRFWQDLERHHPGIDSLRLPVEVAAGWKQRLQTKTTPVKGEDGQTVQVSAPRIGYRECLTPVRAFYLDLAHWAVEAPERWADWVAPCPVGEEEINRRKAKRQLKSRMDARTRERLPVLPVLVRNLDQQRTAAQFLLHTARRAQPGEAFSADGQTFTRSVVPHAAAGKVWADDPTTGKRRDLGLQEDLAFWAWATVELLRATGIRVEELLELTHHSLVQYRLPTTGELVPLLQIAPSKTDTERLLVVSPELAEVLAAIIARIRNGSPAVPLVSGYDRHERLWSAPAPLLFQRRVNGEDRAISAGGVRAMLNTALAQTGLFDADGRSLAYTPHDFRRLFITDAIMNGLPPHIAQVLAGHRDLNVTLGYKAVYPEEAIQTHLAFLARRRALRPSEEYRVPTDTEWQEFLGHFERRKVATGTCGRAFNTPCIHEHACVRCSMLWPDPEQRPRLAEIRDNLAARIVEAEREGWLGEVDGLKISLAGATDKLAQLDRTTGCTTVDLGIPTVSRGA
jgi:integrase